MDPDDFRRRVIQVSAIAGIILLVSAGESILLYASRFDKVGTRATGKTLPHQHRTSYEPVIDVTDGELDHDNPQSNTNLNTSVNTPKRSFFEREMGSLISTDDKCADMQLHKGKSVRKRSAGPSNTRNERRKVRRISAGEGMTALANSMETAIDLLKDIVSGASQCTPRSEALKIQAQAMEAIEKDEGFSDEDIKDAALVIADNPSTANTYLHVKNKQARKSFLLHMMEKLRNKD
ncbi:hypothetical protein F5888DRAFT_1675884 [Russula emetica]|nr:hypothetical protein F5888DRAFT_1675884 [Russula emetica]